MSKAEQFLNSYKPQMPNISADKYIQSNNQAMGNYTQNQQQIMQNYKQQGAGYLNSLKQQTQMQMNNLNNQLKMNMAKYDNMAKYEGGLIQQQHKEQRDAIDQRTFEQYKQSNQMGMQRGVSQSAQQQAMDNSVGQQSSALFYQNDNERNKAVNELNYKIMDGKMSLQMQHMSDTTKLMISQMEKEGTFNMQMAEKELQYASSMADKVLQQQLQNNQMQFTTEKEMEMYKAQVAENIFKMRLQELQAQDNRQHDITMFDKKTAHDIDMFNRESALKQQLASMSGGGGRGGSSGDGSEIDPGMQEMYKAWEIENAKREIQGLPPIPYNAIGEWYDAYVQAPWDKKKQEAIISKGNATNYQTNTSKLDKYNNQMNFVKNTVGSAPNNSFADTMASLQRSMGGTYEDVRKKAIEKKAKGSKTRKEIEDDILAKRKAHNNKK